MANYEQLQQRHCADMLRRAPAFTARADWPPEHLKAERERFLRDLVRTAKLKSPWHRRRLSLVDPDRLREEDLADLPVMTKADLMANYDEILTDRRLSLPIIEEHLDKLTDDAYLLDHYHAIASGGSSGHRGVYVYGWDAWTTMYMSFTRFGVRRPPVCPPPRPTVAAAIMAEKAWHLSASIARTFMPPGAYDYHNLPVNLPLDGIVTDLNHIQPYMLRGYPSALRLLVQQARAGRLTIAPRLVGTSAEPLLPEIREDIEATWHVPVSNAYACSEMGCIGISCGEGTSMHISDDIVIIEPVDEAGNQVGPGDRSAKIYATNLFNPALPLIRFEITDEVTVLDEPCACGSSFRRLEAPQGRLDDGFTYCDGLRVHPLAFHDPLGHNRNVVEYQVRQTPRGADVSMVTKGPVEIAHLRDELIGSLERVGLSRPEISLSVVSRLERTAAGKLKRFLPVASNAGLPHQIAVETRN